MKTTKQKTPAKPTGRKYASVPDLMKGEGVSPAVQALYFAHNIRKPGAKTVAGRATPHRMKTKPILFSAPMVRAILAGTKTQTRRIIKESWNGCLTGCGPHPCPNAPVVVQPGETLLEEGQEPVTFEGKVTTAWFFCSTLDSEARCPYGAPGDRLWVRETWATPKSYDAYRPRDCSPTTPLYYAADSSHGKLVRWTDEEQELGRLRPSIFLPRWASRITLEIESVRVERLNDISKKDAIAEGIEVRMSGLAMLYRDYSGPGEVFGTRPIESYTSLWESINGKDSWALNPWVWAITFRKV